MATVYEDIKLLSDAVIQQLLRRAQVEDLLPMMQQDAAVKELFFRNVKMTTRLWLQSEMDKRGKPASTVLARAETELAGIMDELRGNPPELF